MPQSDLFEGCQVVSDVSDTLEISYKTPSLSFELWIARQRVKRYLVPADDLNAMCFYFGLLLDQFISGYAEKDLRKSKSLVIRFCDYKI